MARGKQEDSSRNLHHHSHAAARAAPKLKGLHSHEQVEQLLDDAEVAPEQAIHTDLDPALYGEDGLWNQQLFSGGSPAEVLVVCIDEGADHKMVPVWWEPIFAGVSEKLPRQERIQELRKAVYKMLESKSKLLFRLAKSAEDSVTTVMHMLEKESSGKLIGIDFRLKQIPSILRKLAFETSANPQKTIAEVMNTRMTDTLRYTILYPTKKYCEFAVKMIDVLVDVNGFASFELRNYWETGHAYDGLNCSFLTDDHDSGGVLFEVQCHTPESFEVKQYESHELYELWRGIDDVDKKFMVFTQMVDKFDAVPRPPGDLMAIGVLNRKTCPEPKTFKKWMAANAGELVELKRDVVAYGAKCGVKIIVNAEDADHQRVTIFDKAGFSNLDETGGHISPRPTGATKFSRNAATGDVETVTVPGAAASSTPGCWEKIATALFGGPKPQGERLLVSGMRDNQGNSTAIRNPMFMAPDADKPMSAPDKQEKFAFIRHGEAEHNQFFRNGEIETGYQIFDPKLTEKGRRQSEALSAYIVSESLSFDVILVSCSDRALETAQIVFSHLENPKVVVTSLCTETAMDKQGSTRVGGPCRTCAPLDELKARFPSTWDWSALESPANYVAKTTMKGCAGAEGWCHPQRKEERLVQFRDLLNSDLIETTDRVAIIGHAEFFKEFVTIKMTACQMIWQEIPSAEELLQRAAEYKESEHSID